jgi:hypothetical protein
MAYEILLPSIMSSYNADSPNFIFQVTLNLVPYTNSFEFTIEVPFAV